MILAVDFDGTCTTHNFPELGKDIGAAPILRKLVEKGHQLILWTMRCDHDCAPRSEEPEIINIQGTFLTHAVNWFKDNNIPLHGIQRNPTQDKWTSSPKCYAHYYLDDAAVGCPLIFNRDISDRPYVDWKAMEVELIKLGLL